MLFRSFFTVAIAVCAQEKQLTGIDKINASYQERLGRLQQEHQLSSANQSIAQQVAQQIRDVELARYNRELEQARGRNQRQEERARYEAERRRALAEHNGTVRLLLAAGKTGELDAENARYDRQVAELETRYAPAAVSPTESHPVKTGINYSTNENTPNLALDPVAITSIGCIGDFVKMKALEGLAQRKLAADLAEFGCIFALKGIYFVPSLRGANVIRGGQTFIKTVPLLAVEKMEQAGLEVNTALDLFASAGEHLIDRHEGYVPLASLVSEQALDAAIRLHQINQGKK